MWLQRSHYSYYWLLFTLLILYSKLLIWKRFLQVKTFISSYSSSSAVQQKYASDSQSFDSKLAADSYDDPQSADLVSKLSEKDLEFLQSYLSTNIPEVDVTTKSAGMWYLYLSLTLSEDIIRSHG